MSLPPAEVGYLAALAMGLLGSVHCVVMCGGVAGALTQALPNASPDAAGFARSVLQQVAMSLGRIATYGVFGAVAGAAGMVIGGAIGGGGAMAFRFIFGLLMVVVGLYVAGAWSGLAHIERAGAGLWQRLSPLASRLRPADRIWKQLALGAVWGWLPCGLVYAALAAAVTSGSAGQGAAWMVSFGLGTLPALLATGLASRRIAGFARNPGTRRTAGALLVVFGLWTAAGTLLPHGSGEMSEGHPHHPHSAALNEGDGGTR